MNNVIIGLFGAVKRPLMEFDQRTKRVIVAVGTAFASKGVSAILQILLMPVAVRSLGIDLYSVYTISASILALIGLSEFGIGPVVIREMTAAIRRDLPLLQQEIASTAVFLVGFVCLLFGGSLICAAQLAPETWLKPPHGPAEAEQIIRQSVLASSLLGSALLVGNLYQKLQAAFQEQHFVNLAGLISNFSVMCGIAVFLHIRPSVINLLLCVYGQQALVALGYSVYVTYRHRSFFPRAVCFRFSVARRFLKKVGHNIFSQYLIPFLQRDGFSMFLFQTSSASTAGLFGILMQLLNVIGGLVTIVTAPLTDWSSTADKEKLGSLIMAGCFGQLKYFWTDDCVLRGQAIAKSLL